MTAIRFEESPRSSVGIEWELMLVDAAGNLVPEAPALLAELADRPGITEELLTNTIEVTSGARTRVRDAVADIRDRLAEVRELAEPRGVGLVSSGSHPFARWHDQSINEKTRYRRLVERTQWWGRNMMIWGMHVHVGVDDRRKVLPIIGELTRYLPHLQALTASSPFWAGEETGYASNRALVFQQLPTTGLPWPMTEWAEFERYVDDLTRTGVIDEVTEVRWDVRPAPRWGTVENRSCDAVSNLTELASIAALVQSIVEWSSRRIDAGEELEPLAPWFHRENKWRAARYGLDATVILGADGAEGPVRADLGELLTTLAPVAEELDCAGELAGVRTILAHGNGSRRQHRVAAAHAGDLAAVVRHLRAEFEAERPLTEDGDPA
ncbi:glutamate--cysteine ligase [Pseudolysinimonas sp.]|uniref:glutamate--cysteine ligase n=1 Tax=Pseudolysinimonas sp. TaxID=2680009 RepID=UPI003F7D375B